MEEAACRRSSSRRRPVPEHIERRLKQLESEILSPPYTHPLDTGELPNDRLPERGSMADVALRLVRDELLLDGHARMNLASFVSTWMEPQAEALMADSADKNMIDRDEYPATSEIERRCVNIVAEMFSAPDTGSDAIGVSTVGSSEASMLAGMAMKWRWRKARESAGQPSDRPNLVVGSNVQVVWEKFCRYWEVEPRHVPVREGRYTIAPTEVVGAVDERTIGVVTTLGTTYTGEYEPVREIHDAVVVDNEAHGRDVPIHVDAATGGFVAPFLDPGLVWDFRLPNVRSINVSGHKYGLVYPGIGFAIWRDADARPEELVFHVDYLGGQMPTYTLNFSRPGSQIVAQYYNFIRLGRAGYRQIMGSLREVATELARGIEAIGPFSIISDGSHLPVVTFTVDASVPYSAYDLSARLRQRGWQVPAYAMPADASHVVALRLVVREGLTRHLSGSLVRDIADASEYLRSDPPLKSAERAGYHH